MSAVALSRPNTPKANRAEGQDGSVHGAGPRHVQTYRRERKRFASFKRTTPKMPITVLFAKSKLSRAGRTDLVRATVSPTLSAHESQGGTQMATQMSKSQLIEKIAAETELPKKGVKEVFETLAAIGYKELKKTGVFLLPGFAKFVVIKKPATKERQGTNPFTKEPMTFKAKPARKIVRARLVKAAKDAV